jgi:hypothetical protein
VSKLDDELHDRQIEAGVNEAVGFFRDILRHNIETQVRSISKDGLRILVTRIISAYEVEGSILRKQYGSTLIDGDGTLGA